MGSNACFRLKGFDKQYYVKLIIELIRKHGPVSRKEIDQLLITKLPDVLDEKQKKNKVHNLLSELSRKQRIRNEGTRAKPRWKIAED